jgi:hypothetical protein
MNMRIHLLLQQATQSGMTGYYSILQAMRLFPEFPWEIINGLYPGELARFQAAVNEVYGRDYIGFWKGRVHALNNLLYNFLSRGEWMEWRCVRNLFVNRMYGLY